MCNPCCGCCGCIKQGNIGIIEKWGRFERLAQPGYHCLNPFFGQVLAIVLSTRTTSLNLYIDTQTKDNVFVQIDCSVQYRVVGQTADEAYYELTSPEEQIKDYVYDGNLLNPSFLFWLIILIFCIFLSLIPYGTVVARTIVPTINYFEIYERKYDVAKSISEELEKVMEAYGYNIERVLVTNIVRILDPAVRKVMNEINAERWQDALAKISGEIDTVKQMFKISEVFYNNDDKRTLLLILHEEKIPISYNDLYAVFSPFGNLKNVKVLSSSDRFHSRIGFEHETDAIRALKSLQGQYIYDGCCRMQMVLASKISDQSNVGTHELGNNLTNADLTLQPPLLSVLGEGSIAQHISHEKHRRVDDMISMDEPPLPSVLGAGSIAKQISHEKHIQDDMIGMDEPPLPPILGRGTIARHTAHKKIGNATENSG